MSKVLSRHFSNIPEVESSRGSQWALECALINKGQHISNLKVPGSKGSDARYCISLLCSVQRYPPLKGGGPPPPLCTLGVLSYIKICIYISPSIHIVKQRWNTYICILWIYLNIYVNKCNSPSIHIVIKNEGTKNSIHLVLHRWRQINK